MSEALAHNLEEDWQPKRLAANAGIAFVGINVKANAASAKTGNFLLTADTFLFPKYKIAEDGFEDLIYDKGVTVVKNYIPVDLKDSLKRYSAFIVTPRKHCHIPIFARIDNKFHNIIPDDSVIVLASKYCAHLGVLYSVFYSVWHEYHCSLLKTESDYDPMEIFETFPFPEELTQQMAHDGQTISDKYSLFCIYNEVGLVEAYKKIEVGVNIEPSFKNIKNTKDILNQELAQYYKLPIKYLNNKEKIISLLLTENKKRELRRTE